MHLASFAAADYPAHSAAAGSRETHRLVTANRATYCWLSTGKGRAHSGMGKHAAKQLLDDGDGDLDIRVNEEYARRFEVQLVAMAITWRSAGVDVPHSCPCSTTSAGRSGKS